MWRLQPATTVSKSRSAAARSALPGSAADTSESTGRATAQLRPHHGRLALVAFGLLGLLTSVVPAAGACEVDVVLVVDASRSLKKTDQNDKLTAAVETFVGALGDGARVALVTFGDAGDAVSSFEKVGAESGAAMRAVLEQPHRGGRRNDIRAGLDVAWQMLQARKGQRRASAVVLLAEGALKVKGSRSVNAAARAFVVGPLSNQLRGHGTAVHAVALDTDASALLATVADRTGGSYARVSDLAGLADIVQRLAPKVCAAQATGTPATKTDPGPKTADAVDGDGSEVSDSAESDAKPPIPDEPKEEDPPESKASKPFPVALVSAIGGGFLVLILVIGLAVRSWRRRREAALAATAWPGDRDATIQLIPFSSAPAPDDLPTVSLQPAALPRCPHHLASDAQWVCPWCRNRYCVDCRMRVGRSEACPRSECQRKARMM